MMWEDIQDDIHDFSATLSDFTLYKFALYICNEHAILQITSFLLLMKLVSYCATNQALSRVSKE